MKNDVRSERTRIKLRESLMEIFQEKPFKEIRVSEITDRADVSRKVFYDHYGSIFDLVHDCYSVYFTSRKLDITDEQLLERHLLIPAIEKYYCGLLDLCSKNRLLVIAVYEHVMNNHYMDPVFDESVKKIMRHLDIFFKDGNTPAGLTHYTVASYAYVLTEYIVHKWIDDGMKEDQLIVAKRMTIVFLNLVESLRMKNEGSDEHGASSLR